MPKIDNLLVVLPVSPAHVERLHAAAGSPSIAVRAPGEATPEDVRAADVIVGNVPPALLAHAGSLRWMQLSSAGYDAYVAPRVLPEGALLTCGVGAYGQAVSEHLAVMVLTLQKKLHLYRDDQRDGAARWSDHGVVASPVGANVLVLGTGDIGTRFASFMHALGAHVTGAFHHLPAQAPACYDEVRAFDELPDLLGQADVVACFLPSMAETRGLVDAAFLACMKPGAILANGGRGDLVDTDALVCALTSGHVGGAALDVTSPEPLPADHPLWNCENALVTPHVAGFWHLPVTLENVVDICEENLRRYVADKPLRNLVSR
ncbi:MAG: D-2-hydroxyacid dehydrogenase [Atopobiaceae bacterium]|nr:D-2-hydroxyacid dehydrogenase [Atopobiaceae bacterium]